MTKPAALGLALVCLAASAIAVSASWPAAETSSPDRAAPRICSKYAAPNGSDRNRGTFRRPFATPQRLLRSLRGGETGCLRGGTYATDRGQFVLNVTKANVSIIGFPREKVRLLGIVQIRHGADGVRLANLVFEGTGKSNTIKVYASDFTLENSDVTNAWRGRSCLILGSNDEGWPASRATIRRNRFHECGVVGSKFDHGIYAANVDEGSITDNVFWNVAGYALILYANAQRTVVAHNVIDGDEPSVRGGISFGGDGDHVSRDNVVEHNVISYARPFNITESWDHEVGSGNVARANCVWQGEAGDLGSKGQGYVADGNLSADPLYVDRDSRDFRLQATSPCLAIVGYDAAATLQRLP